MYLLPTHPFLLLVYLLFLLLNLIFFSYSYKTFPSPFLTLSPLPSPSYFVYTSDATLFLILIPSVFLLTSSCFFPSYSISSFSFLSFLFFLPYPSLPTVFPPPPFLPTPFILFFFSLFLLFFLYLLFLSYSISASSFPFYSISSYPYAHYFISSAILPLHGIFFLFYPIFLLRPPSSVPSLPSSFSSNSDPHKCAFRIGRPQGNK